MTNEEIEDKLLIETICNEDYEIEIIKLREENSKLKFELANIKETMNKDKQRSINNLKKIVRDNSSLFINWKDNIYKYIEWVCKIEKIDIKEIKITNNIKKLLETLYFRNEEKVILEYKENK